MVEDGEEVPKIFSMQAVPVSTARSVASFVRRMDPKRIQWSPGPGGAWQLPG